MDPFFASSCLMIPKRRWKPLRRDSAVLLFSSLSLSPVFLCTCCLVVHFLSSQSANFLNPMAPHSLADGPSRLLLAAVILFHLSSTLAANIVSVREETAFKAQRECARDCFAWNGSGDLIGLFGCRYPYQNECLCRTDLAPAATKHFSTCMDARCTVGPATGDISTAISIYNSYCVANGFEVTAAVAVPAKTTTTAGSQATKGNYPTYESHTASRGFWQQITNKGVTCNRSSRPR